MVNIFYMYPFMSLEKYPKDNFPEMMSLNSLWLSIKM